MSNPINTVPTTNYPNVLNSELSYSRALLLGQGAYGTVHKGLLNGMEVAVKKILLREDKRHDREFNLQKTLNHENVVKLFTQVTDENFRYIAMELCVGDLRQKIEGKYEGPALPSDRDVMYQIADGLDYIHSVELVHRDIKPENILISTEGKMKLSDFGLSKEMNQRHTFSLSGIAGSLYYMAPEFYKLFTTQNNSSEETNMERIRGASTIDIFSAGCVFFEFLTHGIHPFGETATVLINIERNDPVNINALDYNHSIHGIQTLIRKMIEHEPKYRPSLPVVKEFLLMHPADFQASRGVFKVVYVTNGIACARFHPVQSFLTCVTTEDGYLTYLDGNNNFIELKTTSCRIRDVLVPIKALEWNVNGAQRVDFTVSSPTESLDDLLIWKNNFPDDDDIMYEGIHLAATGLDKSIVVWNPFNPDVLATYKKELNKELRIWKSFDYSQFLKHDIETPWRIDGFEWISENRFACCYYQNGPIAGELSGGVIKIYQFDDKELSTSQVVKQFKHSDDKISGIAWNNEYNLLASCSIDGWIKVWNVEKDDPVQEMKASAGCSSLVWCPNRKLSNDKFVTTTDKPLIICGLSNGSIIVWSPLERETAYRTLTNNSNSKINQLMLSPNKRFLASICFENEIVIWSTSTWESMWSMKGKFSEMSWDATSCKLVTLDQKSQMLVAEYVME